MSLYDFANKVACALRPPPDPNPAVVRWRWAVALLYGGFFVGLGSHIALACGWMPLLFSGFASAAAVKENNTLVLENMIYELRRDYCVAEDQDNLPAMQNLTLRIYDMQIRYVRTTGENYPLPDCRIFVARRVVGFPP